MKNNLNISHSRPTIESDDINNVIKILRLEMIGKGKKVVELEEKLCEFIGGIKARVMGTGRSALLFALWALGIKKDDEIIIPTYVCHSVLDTINFIGAKAVMVDIGDDYCIDPEAVKKNITTKTRVVIVAHIFGISAKIKELKKITDENSLYLIEDCAQAIGGEIDKKKLGSFGDISVFSFEATKMITSGEGGAIIVNNQNLLENFENIIRYKSSFFKMSDIQAALALNQLLKINMFIKKRKELANFYIKSLKDMEIVEIPVKSLRDSIFFRFPIQIKRLNFVKIKKCMSKKSINVRKGVDSMLHMDYYKLANRECCKNTELIFNKTLSLPIYPSLRIEEIKYIVQSLKKCLT